MSKSTYILGISAYYHDSAACLLKDGVIVAAIQEERISRRKHDQSLPVNAVTFCLHQAGITIDDVDRVVFYEKPFVKFERVLETFVSAAPKGFLPFRKAVKEWLSEKLWIPSTIKKELKYNGEIWFAKHHESHAASACYTAPFKAGAFLTMDAVGERATTSYGSFNQEGLKVLGVQEYPHSIGYLYSAFTHYCGFKVNSGEYKLMGLAPYGNPKYVDLIRDNIVTIHEDGAIELQLKYFAFHYSLKMISARFEELFGAPSRKPETEIEQFYKDVAASIQQVTQEIILRCARYVRKKTGETKICLSGGVALNCTANGVLLREQIFDEIWIQPASGDAGGALGAAILGHIQVAGSSQIHLPFSPYLGKGFELKSIAVELEKRGMVYQKLEDSELYTVTANLIADGQVVGWFQGRDEWGPRALGNRSILASATNPKMQKHLNLKIKKREDFRPFAPVVMEEFKNDWFENPVHTQFMQYTVKCMQPDRLPACSHVDQSARVQTVSVEQNERIYHLLDQYRQKTGIPVLINTSFNERGEPMVHSPQDAIHCFMNTEMDVLVIENFLLLKKDNPTHKKQSQVYELD